MSEETLSTTDDGPGTPALDASMKIDSASLSSEEADFARQMGFGADEEEEESAAEASPAAPAAEAAAPSESEPQDEAEDVDEAAEVATAAEDSPPPANDPKNSETSPTEAAQASADSDDDPKEAEDDPAKLETEQSSAPVEPDQAKDKDKDKADRDSENALSGNSADFEEIHPRSSADGMQATLESRADEVLNREATNAPTNSPSRVSANADTSALDQEIATLKGDAEAAQVSYAALRSRLAEQNTELEAIRASANGEVESTVRTQKENEGLQTELDTISIDRDHLIDQLAVTSGRLVQSKNHAEKLEASLRAARGALTPLPEGERALRAEVIGLRGRLEESREEYQELTTELSQSATELAIARARVEDRQHEVNSHVERIEELDERMAQNEEQLAGTIARHREVLALSTRLQADNNELRSAQAALEETLQARDLEILAREEHLNVTRQGLSARDLQLVDVNERLDQEQVRCESQDADLQRAEIERDQMLEKIAHRESRIATLTETLARIESAMGHPLPGPDSASRELPQAEWSKPVLAQHTLRVKTKQSQATLMEAEAMTDVSAHTSTAPAVADTIVSVKDEDADKPAAAEIEIHIEVETTAAKQVEIEIADPVPDDSEDQTESCSSQAILAAPPSLPSILSVWRDRRFCEVTGGVGPSTVHGFLAERLQKHLGEPGPEFVFLKSLGGSLPDAEVHLVLALHELGVEAIRMDVLDTDVERADARRQKVELAGLGEIIDVTVGDLEDWEADAPCHAILLSDALYSQPNANLFLDHINASLTNGALLLFLDRIASGPIQLSASALIRLEELWDVLPESLSGAEGLSIVPHRGDDGGFPQSPNDPAGMLLARLDPIVLAGFGHLADLVVGPTRGGALSVDDDAAMHLLESIMTIDESRSLTEHLAPRHGLGVFAHGSAGRTETIGQDWPSAPAEK